MVGALAVAAAPPAAAASCVGCPPIILPGTVSAPTIGEAGFGAVGGPIDATATWSPGSVSGGAASVTSYRVRAHRMSATGAVLSTTEATAPSTARALTVTFSQAGDYRFSVAARYDATSCTSSGCTVQQKVSAESQRSNLVVAR